MRDDDDAIFERRLRDNDFARQIVAQWLRNQGYEVEVPPLRVRPTFADRHAYGDGGDVWASKDGVRHRVETKTTTRPFRTAAQWRFPDMLVCKARDWEEANPKPWKYVIVDATMRYGAVLDATKITPEHRRDQVDKKRGFSYPAYALPPCAFEFVKLR